MTITKPTINESAETELLRATERKRLHALVEANMEVANQLHADDFQLDQSLWNALSKEQYLGGIASGRSITCCGNLKR